MSSAEFLCWISCEEEREDISQYPMVHLLAQGKARGILEQLPMIVLALNSNPVDHHSFRKRANQKDKTRKIKPER